MHPTLCNRLRAELSRVSVAIAEERAAADPDRRRIQELNMRRAWLSDALWSDMCSELGDVATTSLLENWIDEAEREM